jgi:hypothetical protein
MIENEQHQTIKMPEVWKTFGLCDRACTGFNILTATASKRKAGCYLHGMFPEEKIAYSKEGSDKYALYSVSSWSSLGFWASPQKVSSCAHVLGG